MTRNLALCLALIFAAVQPAEAVPHSQAVRAHFQRLHPCPANGKKVGACPGFIRDHKQALCVGGADAVENMAWMTVAAAHAKDRWECKPGWQAKLAACECSGCFYVPPVARKDRR